MPWWLNNNLRMIQNNLRDIDGGMDVEKWFSEIRASHANCVMVGAGGITSFYPTALSFQTPSPYLKGDLLGDIVKICHENGVRVIARFDFSKTHERIFNEHPEWYYVSEDGARLKYNDTMATCVLGEYQQEKSIEIIKEVLERYDVDGIFFNMFGFQTKDYSNNEHGICHCPSCRRAFLKYAGRELPTGQAYKTDNVYKAFQNDTVEALLLKIRKAVKAIDPECAICTYHHKGVDIIREESNSAVDRPLPFFLYSASENCMTAAYSWAGEKTMANVAINAVDIFYRFQGVSPTLTKIRLLENIAAGSQLDYCIIGDFEGYPDRLGVNAMREIFRLHEENEKYYGHLKSPAKVLLFRTDKHSREYLGWFKLLKEKHIQFDVLDAPAYKERPEKALGHEILILPGLSGVPSDILTLTQKSGQKVLISAFTGEELQNAPEASSPALSLLQATYIKTLKNTRAAYLSVKDRAVFPSFSDRDWVILDREFGVFSSPEGSLPLIESAMFGPPERCFGHRESEWKGFLLSPDGRAGAFTFPLGALFYDYGYGDHRDIAGDALRFMAPEIDILTTNAPPAVEIFLHTLPDGRKFLQLLNLSGTDGMTVDEPLPIYDIRVNIAGREIVIDKLELYTFRVIE